MTLNGRPARAGKEIEPGDRLGLRLWNRRLVIEVEQIPERAPSVVEARQLYRIIEESRVEEL